MRQKTHQLPGCDTTARHAPRYRVGSEALVEVPGLRDYARV